MEEQICNYEIENKKEVANRLKDQLSLLKVIIQFLFLILKHQSIYVFNYNFLLYYCLETFLSVGREI